MKLSDNSRLGIVVTALLALFAASVLTAFAADCAGTRAVWWTDALLCVACGSLAVLLWIGSKVE